MRIISKKKLREFWEKHSAAREPLEEWYRTVRKTVWRNIAEVRAVYPHADAVGTCAVFNIKGNDYRLITKIEYQWRTIYIKHVLTHAEYDRERWKNDCGL